MSGSQRRTAQEDSIRAVLFPGYHTTCLPIKWSSLWCLCASVGIISEALTTQKKRRSPDPIPTPPPQQRRNRHFTMPQKGSKYRMDGRLLYKHKAADRPGRPCWCQVSNKHQQDRVIAKLPRADSVRNTDTFPFQKRAKNRRRNKTIDIFLSLCICTTLLEYQTIKSQLGSGWLKFRALTNNAVLDSKNYFA